MHVSKLRAGAALALAALLAMQATAQPSPAESAEARAQRIADRVLEVIRNASRGDTAPVPASPRAPAKPASTKPPANARPAAAPAAAVSGVAAGTAPAAQAAPAAPAAPSPQTAAAETAASAPVTLESVTVQGQRGGVVLFDFEESTSGFSLHAHANWAPLPAQQLSLTETAQSGRQALAARATQRAWLGVDLEEAVDFTELRSISYWLRTDRAKPPTFAIKTGTQYDWCSLTVTATDTEEAPGGGTFVRYKVDVKAADQACRHVDLSDVRGFFWELEAGSSVVLDDVELH